jgi:hypothetical protein
MSGPSGLWRAAAIGTGVAIVLAVAVYLIADASGDPLSISRTPRGDDYDTLPIAVVIGVTVIAGLASAIVALIARRLSNPLVVYGSVVTIGFLVMLYPPFASAEVRSTTAWLITMHVAAAIPIIGTMTAYLRTSTQDAPASG